MEKADVSRWLDDYVQAWKSYDRDAIGALFSDDVSYRYHPYDEPIRGREAVVSPGSGEARRRAHLAMIPAPMTLAICRWP